MNFGLSHALTVVALAGTPGLPALALDSDKDQTATLQADDFELDLETGVRTYRGSVVFRQGSMRLDCDRLVTYYNPADKLDRGVCTGDPGTFQQRPQGRDSDVLGRARSITLDRIKGVVIFEHRAAIEQGKNRISGRRIIYDLRTKKAQVADAESEGKTETAAARPRLIIQPRETPQN